jgi:PhzF family phenazine biosynthesis protein
MKTYFVDSFTNQQFRGNPAAVCMVEQALDETTMQAIATEIGFSETAFVSRLDDQSYGIRFFTPKVEIPLCGHATLAAAKILFTTTELETIRFVNVENVVLDITKAGEAIRMQFPVYDTTAIEAPQAMLGALGIVDVIDQRYSAKNKIILLEIADADLLASLTPDFPALMKSYIGINGVLVTARSNRPEFDFCYRYFWPWAGTNEDPVTGGVQTFLTKYWVQKLNKQKLRAFQSSLRTGMMTTELVEDAVFIYGEAVIMLEGNFILAK